MQNSGNRPAGNLPSRSSASGGSDMNARIKQVALIAIPVIVAVVAVAYFILPNYVTKADFTKNITGVVNDMGTLKTDTEKSVSAMQTTVAGLPASITNQISTAVSQATTAMNGQISSVQTQVNNMAATVTDSKNKLANVDALSTKIDALTTKQVADETTVSSLSTQVANQVAILTGNLTGQAAIQSQQIADLTAQVSLLQQSQSLSISGNNAAWTVNSTGFWNAVPVTIGNSGTLGINVPVKLTINYPVANTNVSAISNISGMVVSSQSAGQIVFSVTLTAIPPSVTYPISVQLSYSGNATGWNYTWSK